MKPSIIFMGTPDFAVPSLQALLDEKYPIKLVVTQPDRPSGRGQKLTPPPVKVLAIKNNIPVLQPESLRKELEAIEKIQAVECDFLVVVAFGQILPKTILDHPKIAPLNVHASLLPHYRGAAPIPRAVLEEESETGVTIQWMVEALDMGDILFQIPCRIEDLDTAASLHDKLKVKGANALLSSLERFHRNDVRRVEQEARIGSYAPKLKKEEAILDFDQPGFRVHRQIMGLNPWPGAECRVRGERIRVHRSRFVPRAPKGDPGTVMEITEEGCLVACEEACVELLELQQEDRKRLPAKEFLKAYSLPVGLVLGGAP